MLNNNYGLLRQRQVRPRALERARKVAPELVAPDDIAPEGDVACVPKRQQAVAGAHDIFAEKDVLRVCE